MSRRRRLVCLLLGHADAVVDLHAAAATAVLACGRCERRRLVGYMSAPLPTSATLGVVTVDAAALELLRMTAEVNGIYASLVRRMLTGQPPL